MSIRSRSVLAVALVAGGVLASAANADVIATFSYDDLAGTFTPVVPGLGSFHAEAVDAGSLHSYGTSSRLVAPVGDADFGAGFVSQGTADFVIDVSVTVINATPGSEFGLGAGNFMATDADGDTITGDLNGFWTATLGGFLNFNGAMSNVFLNDNGVGDGLFNGTLSGSWAMNLPGGPPYEGALVQLVMGASDFFQTGFADRATGVTAQITPAPGALALLGVGGLIAGRRRR